MSLCALVMVEIGKLSNAELDIKNYLAFGLKVRP